MADQENVTLRIPERFYRDHADRDLPSGRIVSETSKGLVVELDPEAFKDLLSDAQFYVDMGVGAFGPEFLGLISSARATIKALEEAS